MQLVTATPFVPGRDAAAAPAAELAEFRFESEAALARAVALAAEQTWIRSYAIDRARRALRVTLAAGTQAVPRRPVAEPSIH